MFFFWFSSAHIFSNSPHTTSVVRLACSPTAFHLAHFLNRPLRKQSRACRARLAFTGIAQLRDLPWPLQIRKRLFQPKCQDHQSRSAHESRRGPECRSEPHTRRIFQRLPCL